VRIGKGGPIFRKEFPPKVEVGNWVRRNKLWGMGTLNKPKTSKPTCSLKIEQTKKTSKPTWSLNIEQSKKHWNQQDH
jgi:hypothetical protein